MKILSCLFLFAVFISCNKTNIDMSALNEATTEVFNTQDKSLQQSMFKLLNPEEKSNVWKFKFNQYLKNNDLNESQTLYIKSLIKIVSPEMLHRKVSI